MQLAIRFRLVTPPIHAQMPRLSKQSTNPLANDGTDRHLFAHNKALLAWLLGILILVAHHSTKGTPHPSIDNPAVGHLILLRGPRVRVFNVLAGVDGKLQRFDPGLLRLGVDVAFLARPLEAVKVLKGVGVPAGGRALARVDSTGRGLFGDSFGSGFINCVLDIRLACNGGNNRAGELA